MMCKKTTFDACRDTHLPTSAWQATQEQVNAYLSCVWTCFEDTTLNWIPNSQRVQYQDDVCSYVTMTEMEKVGHKDRIWRFSPIPDTNQITLGGEGVCTWESVEQFSNAMVEQEFIASFGAQDSSTMMCDSGPDQHGPKSWHVVDQVRVPADLPAGEYLLSWRWDSYMADQLWTGCADVEIVIGTTDHNSNVNNEEEEGEVVVELDNTTTSNCPSPEPSPAATTAPVIIGTGQPVGQQQPSITDAPTKAPVINSGGGVCTDMELSGNWGANGLYTCDTYYNHGGTAYCAHAELLEKCCFCGGGINIIATTQTTPAPSSSPSSRSTGAVSPSCGSYEEKITCLGEQQGCSWRRADEVCGDAPLTAVCEQWDGKKNRCKNEGCKWRNGQQKCQGYWG